VLSDVPKPVNSLKSSVLELEQSGNRIVALTADSLAVTTDLESWTELNAPVEGILQQTEEECGVISLFHFTPDHLLFGKTSSFSSPEEGERSIKT